VRLTSLSGRGTEAFPKLTLFRQTDEIIKIEGVEPRLDIFAALGVLADILGKNGKSFASPSGLLFSM